MNRRLPKTYRRTLHHGVLERFNIFCLVPASIDSLHIIIPIVIGPGTETASAARTRFILECRAGLAIPCFRHQFGIMRVQIWGFGRNGD